MLDDIPLSETHLSELPLELWKRILTLACEGTNQSAQNTILTAFRSHSQTLRTACDSCRRRIRLCSAQIKNGAANLRKLTGLKAVTLYMGDGGTLGHDLLLLLSTVPHLTSLTLTPDLRQTTRKVCCVAEMDVALKPLRDLLQHLCLKDCKLTYNLTWRVQGETDSHAGLVKSSIQAAWSPDLPALKSLSLLNCGFKRVDVSQCRGLEMLKVCGNPSLKSLDLFHATELHKVVCRNNPALYVLNLSRSSALYALECYGNDRLRRLILPVKHGITFKF